MIVTGATGHREYLHINPSKGTLLLMEGNMVDAVFNVAVFAALVLCIDNSTKSNLTIGSEA
jgi:hypothetical protein